MNEQVLQQALEWARSELGSVRIVSDHSKAHGDHESSIVRLESGDRFWYLKIPENALHWHQEVYAYENWASIFPDLAPRLVAVRDARPRALLVTGLEGSVVEHAVLTREQQGVLWHAAGAALLPLHEHATAERFGPCYRDGSPQEGATDDPVAYAAQQLGSMQSEAREKGYLDADEKATLEGIRELLPAFTGEEPIPCHRDYCAANWLADELGTFCGVIDFEFAHWDARVADFSRDPDWAWVRRPELFDAFCEGYGRPFTDREQAQLLVARAVYALSAIVWGHAHQFYGFEREGHEAFACLATMLG